MFISITDFDTEKTDDSHILITLIDSMGQPEKTERFDKTNYDLEKWIQEGYFTTEESEKNMCHILEANDVSNAILFSKYKIDHGLVSPFVCFFVNVISLKKEFKIPNSLVVNIFKS